MSPASAGMFGPMSGTATASPAGAGLFSATGSMPTQGLIGTGGSLGGGSLQDFLGAPSTPTTPGSGALGHLEQMNQAGLNPIQGLQSLLGGNKSPMSLPSLTPPGPPQLYPMTSSEQDPLAWLKSFNLQGG